MRGWRPHREQERLIEPITEFYTGAWAFEAVALVRVFGLDDGVVRDLLTPVGAERLDVADADVLLDAGEESAAMLLLDVRALDPADVGGLLQLSCRDLGLRAPGAVPGRMPQDPLKALPKFDAWPQKVGVRVLGSDVSSGDLLFFPVLEADHETFGGRTIDDERRSWRSLRVVLVPA